MKEPSASKLDPQTPAVKDGAGTCAACSSRGLRRSKWRSGDLSHLLILQWPLRCMDCRKRQYAFLPRAMKAISSKSAHDGDFRSRETWEGYTQNRAASERHARRHRDDDSV